MYMLGYRSPLSEINRGINIITYRFTMEDSVPRMKHLQKEKLGVSSLYSLSFKLQNPLHLNNKNITESRKLWIIIYC